MESATGAEGEVEECGVRLDAATGVVSPSTSLVALSRLPSGVREPSLPPSSYSCSLRTALVASSSAAPNASFELVLRA